MGENEVPRFVKVVVTESQGEAKTRLGRHRVVQNRAPPETRANDTTICRENPKTKLMSHPFC